MISLYVQDRWFKEEEKENPVRSSSSGSSSTSDLKKRLQDLPSPNKTARLASRAINISRRLSRKRDLYFYSATNRIEENDEKEEQQLVLSGGSSSETKYSDARIRRRARIRLESVQTHTVGNFPSNDGNNRNLKSDDGNKTMSRTNEQISSTIETAKSDSQLLFPSSGTHDVPTPHYNQQRFNNDSSKSQRNSPSLQMFSNLSSEDSPRNVVKLQPVYPISLCNVPPSRFGGYRPKVGVVLQNLSSGSEPESDFENTTNKEDIGWKIDYLGLVSSHENTKNSNNDNCRNAIGPSVSKISLNKLLSPSVKNDNEKASTVSSRTATHENHFCRLQSTPRSDYGSKKNIVDKTIDQRTFLSARENIYDCHKRWLELQPSFASLDRCNISSNVPNEKASVDTHYCNEKDHYSEKSPQNYQQTSASKELFVKTSRSNRSTDTDQAVSSKELAYTKGSYQSLETICWEPMLENSWNSQHQKTVDSRLIDAVTSNYFLDQNEKKDVRISKSTNIVCKNTEKVSSPLLKYCPSEGYSTTSSLKESFTDELEKKEDALSWLSIENNENLSVKTERQNFQEEYVNIPSLTLNSQELSSSVSPVSKDILGKHLNADDLIEVLSKVSLLHTKNTYEISCNSNSEKVETGNTLKTSLKIVENPENCATSFRSHNTLLIKSDTVSIDSSRQIFPQEYPISDSESFASKNTLPECFEGSSTRTNFANSINKTPISSKAANSNERGEYSDLEAMTNDLRNCNECESPGYLSPLTRETRTKDDSSPLQIQKNSDETFGSSNLPVNQKEHKKDRNTDFSFIKSEPINNYITTTTTCYDIGYSASRRAEDSDNFITRTKSVVSTTLPTNCQINCLQSTYDGQINEALTERTKNNLLKNQVGDGRFIENSNKSYFKSSSSSPDEKPEGHNTMRISLEKMAAEQFRKNIYTEQTKTIQSETSTFFAERINEPSLFSVTQPVPASKLRHPYDSSRVRKKSQDRFPFTMSEKPSAASYKFSEQFENLNRKSNSLENTYKLDLHPSITRLAGAGFDDTPAEIIDYVSYGEERPTRSGMRGFMQKFSIRLKKSKKRNEKAKSDTKMTNILYKNRDYKEDSAVNSCSESSLTKEFKIYRNSSEKSSINEESSKENCTKAPENKSPSIKNESCKDTLHSVNSYMQYGCDNLWVQQNKNFNSNNEIQIAGTPKEMDENMKKDSYSVFYVKSSQITPEVSATVFLPEENARNDISAKKKHKVKFRNSALAVIPKVTDENVVGGSDKRRNFRNNRRQKNVEKGCLCLRFYRMVIPASKHRSQIRHSASSMSLKRKSRLSSRLRRG